MMKEQIEGLVDSYKHKIQLFETMIGLKEKRVQESTATEADKIDYLECKAKLESYKIVVDDLEEVLRTTPA